MQRESLLRSIEEPWEDFLRFSFWRYFCDRGTGQPLPFADHHRDLWRWVWGIETGKRSSPFVAIWPRDGGKSTNAELACVALGARKTRRYILYVSGTQDQADEHVQNVAAALESEALGKASPALCSRSVNRFGHAKGWRRNRLYTASGFVVDALGLNTASRGIKIDADRPDFIILDDIDDEHDSLLVVNKKIRSITRKILPTGANHLSVLAVQNLIHPDSVFAQLEDGRASFLADRIVSGPHPAIRELKFEQADDVTRITEGTPTWEGLSVKRCEEIILDIGVDAFLVEHQHERNLKEGGIVTDLWRDTVHVLSSFEVPDGWSVRRSFDWGSTRPFCSLFSARSDGESEVEIHGKKRVLPKGSIVVVAEDYGWNGKPNQGLRLSNDAIARRILKAQAQLPFASRVRPGPADTSIFDVVNGESIAQDMSRAGVRWTRAAKGPGSRVNGAQKIRSMMAESLKEHPEGPCLYFVASCTNTIRTLKTLPRDQVKVDDVDTDAEDHPWDTLRYEVLTAPGEITKRKLGGL